MSLHLESLQSPQCLTLKIVPWITQDGNSTTWKIRTSEMDGMAKTRFGQSYASLNVELQFLPTSRTVSA